MVITPDYLASWKFR
uniref:Uncharacterized protein n=1 Tax=Leersia perrieri TaxID=77586 RepID=A0A0D9XM17_9ORYZ